MRRRHVKLKETVARDPRRVAFETPSRYILLIMSLAEIKFAARELNNLLLARA